MKGETAMKIMRINDKRAFYIRPKDWNETLSEDEQSFEPITGITKDDLLAIVDYLMTGQVEMDEYKEELIANPAERIVYKQIYDGLMQTIANKDEIMADVDSHFAQAMNKYD